MRVIIALDRDFAFQSVNCFTFTGNRPCHLADRKRSADGAFPAQKPATYGASLLGVYAVWTCVVAMLYPVCHWFATLEQGRREWWWSYL